MFEPLQHLIDKHATNYAGILSDIREHLSQLVANTEAQVEQVQYEDKSYNKEITAESNEKAEIRFHNESLYWRVFQTIVSGGKANGICKVYLNAVSAGTQIDVIEMNRAKSGQSNAKYYVPPRGHLIFVFTEQPVGSLCVAHFQADRLVLDPEYTRRPSVSHDVSAIDKQLQEGDRHKPQRTEKPSPDELLQRPH